MGFNMEKELETYKPVLDKVLPSTRYWAGRHHMRVILGVASSLATRFKDHPFSAKELDAILKDLKIADETTDISKGKRWAYLQVQRDIGFVKILKKDKYIVTGFGLCLIESNKREEQCLAPALIRPFEEKNPIHIVLNLFVEQWPDSIDTFISKSQIVGFRRESEKSIFVIGPKLIVINGLGKNEVNQIWNGILPFLEAARVLARFDPREGTHAEKVYGPVWDWKLNQESDKSLLVDLKDHVRNNYPIGKMIELQDLVYDFWKIMKISPQLTKDLMYLWSSERDSEIYLIRAPLAVAEEMENSYIIRATATYGAFTRRRY